MRDTIESYPQYRFANDHGANATEVTAFGNYPPTGGHKIIKENTKQINKKDMNTNYDISNAVQQVVDGYADPIEVLAFIKAQIDLLEKCKSEIEDYAIIEAEKFGSKSFEYKGYKIELRDGAKRFNFKNIKEWAKLNEQIKEVEEKSKIAFASYQKGNSLTVTNDGEVVELPEVSFSKKSIIIKQIK